MEQKKREELLKGVKKCRTEKRGYRNEPNQVVQEIRWIKFPEEIIFDNKGEGLNFRGREFAVVHSLERNPVIDSGVYLVERRDEAEREVVLDKRNLVYTWVRRKREMFVWRVLTLNFDSASEYLENLYLMQRRGVSEKELYPQA